MKRGSDPQSALPALSYTGARIDRAAELRHDPGQIAALLATGDPVAVACDGGRVAVDADGTRLARTAWNGDPAEAVLLGIEDGRPVLAVSRVGDAPTMSLRDAGTALSQQDSALAAYLVALLNWHGRHGFCAVCGSATQMAEAGLSRRCPECGATHFPRTDPVVIMAVESEGRLLMGSRAGWNPALYSVLAGFVSSAETPEEAVIREVREESGIQARDASYVASQPWPFPASLMLGFRAQSDGGDPQPGGDGELSDVRWFPRDEVLAMQTGESALELPGEVSIARMLIDLWASGA